MNENCTLLTPKIAVRNNSRSPADTVPQNYTTKTAIGRWFRRNLILILTVLSVVLGVAIGSIIRASHKPSLTTTILIGFPGEILMNMLKMMILPLIMSSLISGIAQLDMKSCGRIGTFAMLYYFLTTVLAVILGIILVLSIHPGNMKMKNDLKDVVTTNPEGQGSSMDTFMDLIRNMFPENIVQATFQQAQTKYVNKTERKRAKPNETMIALNLTTPASVVNASNETAENITYIYETTLVRETEYKHGMNVLGFIVFCIAFGIVVSQMGEQANLIVQFFVILDMVIMKLVSIIMWYSPIGIMSLIAGKIISFDNIGQLVSMLGMYMLTVITGLIIHALIVLPGLYLLCVRKNPFIFMKNMFQAWITAVGTASSAATLPVTFRCLEEKNKVDKRVTRFVLPVGATINMDGTALYEAVAAIFIAQLNNRILSFGEVVLVSLTATLASIGAASVPSAGLVTMLLVLTAVHLPTEDVSLIVAVDWMLDRLRTSVNVLGDAYGAGIVHHLCRHDLQEVDIAHPEKRASVDLSHNGPAGGYYHRPSRSEPSRRPSHQNDTNFMPVPQQTTVVHRPFKTSVAGMKEEHETLM